MRLHVLLPRSFQSKADRKVWISAMSKQAVQVELPVELGCKPLRVLRER